MKGDTCRSCGSRNIGEGRSPADTPYKFCIDCGCEEICDCDGECIDCAESSMHGTCLTGWERVHGR